MRPCHLMCAILVLAGGPLAAMPIGGRAASAGPTAVHEAEGMAEGSHESPIRPGEGLALLLQVEHRRARVLAYEPTRAPDPHRVPPAPRLTKMNYSRIRPGEQEIVLAFVSGDGVLLEAYGLAPHSVAFAEQGKRGSEYGLDGFLSAPDPDQRLVILPVPEDAMALAIARVEVRVSVSAEEPPSDEPHGPRGGGRPAQLVLEATPLAALLLRPPSPGDFVLPLPRPFPRQNPLLPDFEFTEEMLIQLWVVERLTERPISIKFIMDGEVEEVVQLHGQKDLANRFDIVIMGDGFDTNDLPKFDKRAELLTKGLLGDPSDLVAFPGIEPFASLKSLITVHALRVRSTDSGVTNCPCDQTQTKRTYFRVRGNYTDHGAAGDFGTDAVYRIWAAASVVGDIADIELVLLIANCDVYGGKTYPDLKVSFLSMYSFEETSIYLAAHEAAHSMAVLGDEYISCAVPEAWHPDFLNVAEKADVDAGAVWWKELAQPDELDNGELRLLHACGDPMTAYGNPIVSNPAHQGSLGLFWGAQYIEAPAPPCDCDVYKDPRGCDFFRGMAKCKMRKLGHDFCRICNHALTKAITEAAQ